MNTLIDKVLDDMFTAWNIGCDPKVMDLPRVQNTGLRGLISKPHNLYTVKDENGDVTSQEYTSILHSGVAEIESNIPGTYVLDDILDVVKDNIVTITRDSGTKLFNAVPSYSGASYNVVAIAIDASGITISISNILNGYTVTVTDSSTSTQLYPAVNP